MNDAVHEEFVELHVVSKNVQSIEGWKICCWKWPYVNLICFVYRNVGVQTGKGGIESVHGDLVYLSGGCMYRGVGVVVSAQFRKKIGHVVSFHAYGPRVGVLKFCVGELKCECFSVYFPTSWDTNVAVEGIYETLQLLLDNCRANGAIPIIGGDFNASIGSLLDGEDL